MANASTTLALQGMTPEVLYSTLTSTGLNEVDASILVSSWIYHNFGTVQRTFAYGAAFDAIDADCVASFTRSFVHTDWVDGESVVQAQQTTAEEGFNVRFHKIEADIDALAAEIAKIYACVAEMRSALHDRLEEIKTELNRIDADVFTSSGPVVSVGPKPVFGNLVNNAQYAGVTKLGDQVVSMWNTTQGIYMLPAVNPVVGDPVNDARVQNAASFAAYVAENPAVAKSFANAFTVGDFVAKYGDAPLSNGLTVSQALSSLPSNAQFTSVNDLDTAVVKQSASALSAGSLNVGSVVAAALGTTTGALSSVSISRLATLPVAARTALAQAGITTFGQLAAADATTVQATLQKSGVTGVSVGDAAGAIATAKTITALGT